jgi:dTDP-4-amino-4,6-dideoxygalactose transaminase/DNA-binding NarL/FixJ family response regulator
VEAATLVDRRSTSSAAQQTRSNLGVAAEDPTLRRRIVSLLRDDGLLGPPSAEPLQGSLRACLGQLLDVLIYAGEPSIELARAVLAAKQEQPGLRVVVIAPARSSRGLKARHALGYGIDGVVEEADLETALGSTVLAVLDGQAVAPGAQASDLIAPVLSHREQQALALLALGLANAEIASRMFLARSTVKSHLSSAFSKLGVGSRSEAAALVLDRETAVGRGLAVLVERERANRAAVSSEADAGAGGVPDVPFVDLERQHAPLAEELRLTFDRVARSGAFTLGEEVERFEADFAAYCDVEHCVGVSSGTAALTLALAAAGIGPGDEVIVPAHTFIASALAIIHSGASPVLCDVDDATGLLSAAAAAAALTERTAAIIAVHLYGQACDMTSIAQLAQRHGLAVFEDAAQAHGASFAGRRVGGFGTAAAFSFYPSKNLGALGDGGAICTNDAAVAERARWLRNLGQRSKGEHLLVGPNERLDGLQAALLRVKLPHLDGWNLARTCCAERYRERLGDAVWMAACHPEASTVHHIFPVRLDERSKVAEQLRCAGIQTGVHYDRALHEHAALRELPGMPVEGELPVAEAWARQELSLPMFAELSIEEVDRVVDAFKEVMDGSAAVT